MIGPRVRRAALAAVLVPLAGRAAWMLADRRERRTGPDSTSRRLRQVGSLLSRGRPVPRYPH